MLLTWARNLILWAGKGLVVFLLAYCLILYAANFPYLTIFLLIIIGSQV